MYVKYC